MWAAVRGEVAAGRQAYVVCPLIEESREARGRARPRRPSPGSAAGELAGLRLGLLHGRLRLGREGGDDGPVPRAARSTCWWPPRSSRSASTSPTPPSWSSSTPTASASPSSTSSAGRVGPGQRAVVLLPGQRGRTRPTAEARLEALVRDHRRLRAGRGRPRPAGRGHDHGRAAEGPQRPQAGVAAPRPRVGRAGPRGGVRHRRRRSGGLEATPTCSTRSPSSSTRTTRSSCSRASGGSVTCGPTGDVALASAFVGQCCPSSVTVCR